jgi:ureidoacrylate peracid hydrolase
VAEASREEEKMDSALLCIDMQNGFVHPDGSFLRTGRTLFNRESVIEENVALLGEARERGMPVVHTAHVHRRGYVDAPPFVVEMFEPVDGIVGGTWDGAHLDELAPAEGEPVVYKNRYDAFLYTDLEVVLRSLGVRSLLIAGVVTHGCVESTARAADMRDFDVTVATDAVSSIPEFHEPSLKSMSGVGIRQLPWREALAMLREREAAETAATGAA